MYRDEMLEAIKLTRWADVWCEGAQRFEAVFDDPPPTDIQKVKNFLSLRMISPNDRMGDCAGMHTGYFINCLPYGWEYNPVITIGNVSINGKPKYAASPEYLLKQIDLGPSDEVADLHVWLTFPDLHILDVCLGPVLLCDDYEVRHFLDKELNLLKKPDEIEDLIVYHPIILGEEYLARIGAVIPRALAMIAGCYQRFYSPFNPAST